ncbi:MAG: helix-turn-helix domain-containing protein [Magnetococcales bacterium]|nr:helix-turn-helix domain-containing protein [Magnetococcales bacterium]
MADIPEEPLPSEERSDSEEAYFSQQGDFLSEKEPTGAGQVGLLLRQTREGKGFSIDEMSQQTRLRDVHLISLEAGEVDKLPGHAFVAGFLRLYAKNLGLINHPLIEQFLADFENKRQNLTTEHFPSPTKSKQRPNSGAIIGGLAGLVALSFAYSHYYGSQEGDQSLPESPPLKVGDEASLMNRIPQDEETSAKSTLHFGKSSEAPLTNREPTESELLPTQLEADQAKAQLEKRQQNALRSSEKPPFKKLPVIQKELEEAQARLEKDREDFLQKQTEAVQRLQVKKPQEKSVASLEKSENLEVLEPKPIVVPEEKRLPTTLPKRSAAPLVKKPEPVNVPLEVETIKPFVSQVKEPPKPVAEAKREDDSRLPPRQRIMSRYPEPVNGSEDLKPDSPRGVSLLSKELVWVQIQDEFGEILKDMVMQPNHLFRVPAGMRFFAVLGSAGDVQIRVGTRPLPSLGESGEVIQGLELSADVLLNQVEKR